MATSVNEWVCPGSRPKVCCSSENHRVYCSLTGLSAPAFAWVMSASRVARLSLLGEGAWTLLGVFTLEDEPGEVALDEVRHVGGHALLAEHRLLDRLGRHRAVAHDRASICQGCLQQVTQRHHLVDNSHTKCIC